MVFLCCSNQIIMNHAPFLRLIFPLTLCIPLWPVGAPYHQLGSQTEELPSCMCIIWKHPAYSPCQVKKEPGEIYMGLSLPLPGSDTHHFSSHITAHTGHVDLPNYKRGAKGILVSFTISALYFCDPSGNVIPDYLVRFLGTNSSLHLLSRLV